MDTEDFPRKTSIPKEVGWHDIFKNVLSKRLDSEELTSTAEPALSPIGPARVTTDGVTYVKLQPSKDLAILACTSDETIQAVKGPTCRCKVEQCAEPNACKCGSCIWEDGGVQPSEGTSKEPHFDPFSVKPPRTCSAKLGFKDGIMQVFWKPGEDLDYPPLLWETTAIPTVSEYLAALQDVMIAVQDPGAEIEETKNNKHRDFYNVRKVDTHVHHSACMHQKHLLRFIRKKYRTEGHTVVAVDGGKEVTLLELFQKELGLSAREASVDHLNVHALGSCFQRFDLFNQKYNPFGQARLRTVFLKTDNHINGRFLAELTKEVIADLDDRKYQHAEWRLSIYGRCPREWERLAAWVVDNGLHSRRVRWLIQVPRLYHVYRRRGEIPDFGTLLYNVFHPLFEAVKDPQKYRKLFLFLQAMVGFDSVDDESRVSKYTMEGGDLPSPLEWTSCNNPPYSYWAFYMYANIRALNLFLEARHMRPLSFRPHCGEAGSTSHLAAAFLLADGINHGILLKEAPVLQYMFYLKQIGIAVSPLSNNALFVDIAKNPLYSFFKIGLNVSLSTDDPLMFHFTDEPLLEEYSIAAHVWKLSPVDLCELARNSVLQSGFEDEFKRHWLGETYWLPGIEGNDLSRTNVSNIRLQYRFDTWREELEYMREILNMRMALRANQKQQIEVLGSLAAYTDISQRSRSLQELQQGLQALSPLPPALAVEPSASIDIGEHRKPANLPRSAAASDSLSPSMGSSNQPSVRSSPVAEERETLEVRQRRRSLAEHELDELSCAAHQLTLSMKLSLPPAQSQEPKA